MFENPWTDEPFESDLGACGFNLRRHSKKLLPHKHRSSVEIPPAAPAPREVTPPPKIGVLIPGRHGGFGQWAESHLQNKRGYLWLRWREGKRVRSYYLGKASKNYPTRQAAIAGPPARPL